MYNKLFYHNFTCIHMCLSQIDSLKTKLQFPFQFYSIKNNLDNQKKKQTLHCVCFFIPLYKFLLFQGEQRITPFRTRYALKSPRRADCGIPRRNPNRTR